MRLVDGWLGHGRWLLLDPFRPPLDSSGGGMVVMFHEDGVGMGGPPLSVVRSHLRACPLGLVLFRGVKGYSRLGLSKGL